MAGTALLARAVLWAVGTFATNVQYLETFFFTWKIELSFILHKNR